MTYELQGRAAHPLVDLFEAADFPLADLIPTDALAQVFDGLYYTEARAYPSGDSAVFNVHLAFENELALEPAGDEGPAIVFGETDAGWTVLETNTVIGPQSSFSLVNVPIALRIPRDVLRDVETDGPAMLAMHADFRLSSDSGFTVLTDETLTLAESEIANTGVTVSAGGITWNFERGATIDEAVAAGITGEFIGLGFRNVKVKLPPDFTGFPDFSADYCVLGTGGVSGRFHATYSPQLNPDTKRYTGDGAGELFGIPLALFDIQIEVKQTALTTATLQGKLLLPFFDEYVDVTISINLDGTLSVRLSSPDGLITLTKKDLLKLKLESIQFELVEGIFRIKVAGELTPLFGETQGVQWTSIHVDELSIDSKGNIHLAGGWLNLRQKYQVKVQGFQVEVSKLGFGNTEDGGKWVGLTGGVKLVAGMPAGASVEGLRLTWFEDGRSPKISLNGVRVGFEVPNTLKFAGEVSYDSNAQQFRGAVKLDLIALRMQIDATAVFGMKDGKTYLAIYLAAEFPAGIPLFATGLGVYGMAGLFAMNMEPNRRADQPWYALNGAGNDWYHEGDPDGVTNLTKWNAVPGSLGFGAGVTLGTLADNGHTFSGKMLLAIVFPGPILIMQGSASLLQERTALDKDANFSAIAVLDGRAGTLQVGLDAQYRYDKTNGSLIDIHGSAEGFFNFNDPNAWRLNLGLNEPRERRLSARLFKLFDSYSYVMLNPQQLAMGAWVGFQQQWQFGPLNVGLEAWIDGNARVSWKPAHFYGDVSLHGSARLSVFGFSAGLTVDARLAADVFDPLHILGNFRVGIDLPWPLSDISVNVKLEWGPQLTPPPIPLPLKEIAVEHFKTTTSWPLPRVQRGETKPLLLPNYDGRGDGFFVNTSANPVPDKLDHLPVVPLDSRPHITFARNVNDDALVGVNAQPVVPEFERIGDPVRNQGPARVRYGLEEVALEKLMLPEKTWKEVARKGMSPNGAGVPTLFGSWAPMPQMPGGGGRNVGQTKLWLWSKTPFEYTRRSGRAWDEWFSDEYTDYPCQTLPGSGWNFEEIDLNDNLGREWRHPDEPELVFGSTTNMAIREMSRPSHGMTHALAFTNKDRGSITLPRPTNLVRIMIPDSRYERFQDFVGRDKDRKGFAAVMGGTEDRPYIQISGIDLVEVDYYSETNAGFSVLKELGGAIGCSYVPSLNKLIFVEFDGKLSEFDVTSDEYKILGTGYTNPEDIVVTAAGDTAYITERSGTLLRVDLTRNTDRENAVVISEGMTAPHQIALDEEGGQAYVVEYDDLKRSGRLLRIPLTGPMRGNQITLAEGLDQAVGLLVTNDLTTAYVSEQANGGRLIRIDLATGNSEIVVTDLRSIFMLRWANAEQDTILATQREFENLLIRISLNNPEEEPHKMMFGLPALPSSVALLPDDRYVICCDQTLVLFSTTLMIPMIVDIDGNVLVRHFEDEFVRWTHTGDVLEPHTTYRLKVKTSMKVRGEGKLAGYKPEPTAIEYAYFRTDGPPGVASLSVPVGTDPNSLPGGKFVSPLDDLSRYVRRTMPALAAPTPDMPVPSRLFYRAYDVGMEFDENYVELMYRIGRRDLSIHLHDSNGAIRDDLGRRLVLANQWGKAETVTLTDREERWLSVLSTAGCSLIPIGSIVKNSTFNAATAAHSLPPSALCEARLVPALLHDAFAGYKTTVANGPNGMLERWQVRDDAGSPNSQWKIEGTDDPLLGQVAGNAASSLVYSNASELAASHPEQPSTWNDYRLTVHMRFTQAFTSGRVGMLWRYRNAGEHYRFIMEPGRCQLIRMFAGVPTPLATKEGFTVPSTPFAITVEAIGSSFNVYLGDERLVSATDAAIETGSVGVYSGTVNARFTDVYVDDFRKSAPVVYRFSFLSSRFKNFVEQMGTFEGKTSRALLGAVNVAPMIAAAGTIGSLPLESEMRAYDSLVALLPGVVASSPVVRVTRVEQNNSLLAFLVQSPEPLDWKRIHVSLLRAELNTGAYVEIASKVLRKADGAGIVVVSPVPTPPGSLLTMADYRVVFTYRRDNRVHDDKSEVLSEAGNTSPEEATLNLPWSVQSAQRVKELVEMLVLS